MTANASGRLGHFCRAAVLVAAAVGLSTCSGGPTAPSVPPGGGEWVMVGAGDIGECGVQGPALTARLIDAIPGQVFTTGDNAYPRGAFRDFVNCYAPHWGRFKDRTRPTPGNHDYDTPGAADYFEYFGEAAGPPGQGFYSYSVGPWRVLALNSEVAVGASSVQAGWLRNELAREPARCTIAIWHRPLYSSGPNGPNSDMRALFDILHQNNVDIVLTGHDHLYERFAPQDADGRADHIRGIRQFTVGTGGTHLSQAAGRARNSEVVVSVWGVLRLSLKPESYEWTFISAEDSAVRDAGIGVCH